MMDLLKRRERLEFRYFFNAGLDKATGICDGEGSDVFYVEPDGSERYLGALYDFTPADVAEMSDLRLEWALTTGFIAARLD